MHKDYLEYRSIEFSSVAQLKTASQTQSTFWKRGAVCELCDTYEAFAWFYIPSYLNLAIMLAFQSLCAAPAAAPCLRTHAAHAARGSSTATAAFCTRQCRCSTLVDGPAVRELCRPTQSAALFPSAAAGRPHTAPVLRWHKLQQRQRRRRPPQRQQQQQCSPSLPLITMGVANIVMTRMMTTCETAPLMEPADGW